MAVTVEKLYFVTLHKTQSELTFLLEIRLNGG